MVLPCEPVLITFGNAVVDPANGPPRDRGPPLYSFPALCDTPSHPHATPTSILEPYDGKCGWEDQKCPLSGSENRIGGAGGTPGQSGTAGRGRRCGTLLVSLLSRFNVAALGSLMVGLVLPAGFRCKMFHIDVNAYFSRTIDKSH